MLILKKNINTLSDKEYSFYLSLMTSKKQKEIAAYRFEEDKKRSVCGYMLALKALSEFLNEDESEIKISYQKNGKPVCDKAFLSIAHAGDYAVCAVSALPVGIDAENANRKVTLKAAMRVCTENEMNYIFGEPTFNEMKEYDKNTKLRFLEVWTKKEAFGKMTGEGINYDMKNTDVSHIKTRRDGELIISVTEKAE